MVVENELDLMQEACDSLEGGSESNNICWLTSAHLTVLAALALCTLGPLLQGADCGVAAQVSALLQGGQRTH